jgi:Holliday junction DNA helicase RuvA
MIGRLRGLLLEKQAPYLLIDVTGVGYEVQASMQTFYQLPGVGKEVTLYTHFVVREDAQQLFGFYTIDERALFRALLKVNGVGPKLALTILSSVSPDEFIRCVNDNDAASLVRLPGVGKKTAERLIIEMRDRLNDIHADENLTLPMTLNHPKNSAQQDAISALIALGYKPHEASRGLQGTVCENHTSEELIRLALKRINA